MTTIQGSSQVATPPPTAQQGTADPTGNNELEFDPTFNSTYTFDPTHPATVFKNSYGTPGTDLSTQTYLMLDGMVNNPYNTTDAQLFFIFTSELVASGAIGYSYNVGTADDPKYVSLDDIISGITVTDPVTGEETPLMACLVDVVIQEKYAAEVEKGNTDWSPTANQIDPNTGEEIPDSSFCDALSDMFPGDSEVSQQVNAEIDTYDDPTTWASYTEEMAESPDAPQRSSYNTDEDYDDAYAAYLREDTSQQWADDVNNSNMVEQESIMREAMVHDMGTTGGLMASLMLLYMLLEAMGYSDLAGLTGQVNWYQERTDDLTEMSPEWASGFDSPEDAYEFVGQVESFVDEVNSNPQFADSSLVNTVNSSLGEDGFLGMKTNYYYYDTTTATYQQANIDYLYNNPDEQYYDKNADSGYCDTNGNEYTYGNIYEMSENSTQKNTPLYKKETAGDGSIEIVPQYQVSDGSAYYADPNYDYKDPYYDANSPQARGQTNPALTPDYIMQNDIVTDPDAQSGYYIENGDGTYSPVTWGEMETLDPDTEIYGYVGNDTYLHVAHDEYTWQETGIAKGDAPHWNKTTKYNTAGYYQSYLVPSTDGKTALYNTFDSWSLDPSGQTAPAPQYGQIQSDFRESDTGFTDAAGTSTTLENQTANWIQEVESAMSKAISTYIDAINTLIDNQTVQ